MSLTNLNASLDATTAGRIYLKHLPLDSDESEDPVLKEEGSSLALFVLNSGKVASDRLPSKG